MKNIIFILLLFSVCARSQTYIDPIKIEVGTNKTTNLVFSAGIVSIDRGSQNILVQKSANNILRVKAEKEFVGETNLTVVTNEGRLYSFIVSYCPDPLHLNINLAKTFIKGDSLFITMANRAGKELNNITALQYSKAKVKLSVTGFYVSGKYMLCKLRIENRSQIGYDIDQFRFYLRDNKQAKRTSMQEAEIKPLFISGDTAAIAGKAGQTIVVVVPKFTIPDAKHVALEILEKNGGRHLYLKIRNRQVMLAKMIK